jgi:transposase
MRDRFDHTLERKLDTKPDNTVVVARGIVSVPGRRREWPTAEKARIIVESWKPGANVSEVARRNGMSPQQLFGWRREARELFADDRGETCATSAPGHVQQSAPTAVLPAFVPVVVAASIGGPAQQSDATDAAKRADASRTGATDVIELVIGSCVVRVNGRVDADALKTVIETVRRFACS